MDQQSREDIKEIKKDVKILLAWMSYTKGREFNQKECDARMIRNVTLIATIIPAVIGMITLALSA